MKEEKIGEVVHYFSKIGVAAIKVTSGSLSVGDTIHIRGHTTDFQQRIDSIQIEHATVQKVGPGDDIGIKVTERVREGDQVYKATE